VQKILQKIGTCFLVASLVTLFLEKFVICYILLGIALGLDIWTIFREEETITQWYKPLLPKRVDIIITVAIPLVFIIFHNPLVGLYFLMGTIHGHLNFDW